MSSTSSLDPYIILGVPKDATTAAIRSAYRKLVLRTHPDKVQDESLRAAKQDEFHRIQQAYELLTDDGRRREHDEHVALTADDHCDYFSDRFQDGNVRVEVRTAAPTSDYQAAYAERKAGRTVVVDDDPVYPPKYEVRFAYKKPDSPRERRRTSRSAYDDYRKATRDAEDDDDRARIEHERLRQSHRDHHSDRRRTRDRERRRGYDEKHLRVDGYVDDDDDDGPPWVDDHPGRGARSYHVPVVDDVDLDRPRKKTVELRRGLGLGIGLDDLPLRRGSEDDAVTDRKMSHAREYMESVRTPRLNRSATTGTASSYDAAPAFGSPPPPPPVPASSAATAEDDAVRRSSARRPSDRDHRGSRSSRPSRKGSSQDRIEIVESGPAYETRSRLVHGVPREASSPSSVRGPPFRAGSGPHRSSTVQTPRDARSEAISSSPPSLPRSSTMPSGGLTSSSRRDRDRDIYSAGSSRLRSSFTEIDSGYSSPGTPGRSPTRHEYIVVQDVEPRSSGRSRKGTESDDWFDRRHRSPSPLSVDDRSTKDPTRPPLLRGSSTVKSSPIPGGGRTTSYSFSRRDGGSARADPSSSASSSASSYLRGQSTGTGTTRYPPSNSSRVEGSSINHPGGGGGGSSRRLFGEVQYSPRIGSSDIRFADSHSSSRHYHSSPSSSQRSQRTGSVSATMGGGSGVSETVHRDAAPPRSRSHYVYGPHHGIRAETST